MVILSLFYIYEETKFMLLFKHRSSIFFFSYIIIFSYMCLPLLTRVVEKCFRNQEQSQSLSLYLYLKFPYYLYFGLWTLILYVHVQT